MAEAQVQAAQQHLNELLVGSRPQEIQAAQQAAENIHQQLLAALAGSRPQEIQQAQQAAENVHQQLLAALAGSRPQEIAAARAQVAGAQQHLRELIAGSRPQEIAEAKAAVAQAAEQARVARAALELAIIGPRKETIASSKGRVEQAKGDEQTAHAVLHQTKIYAPTEGRVTLRAAEPGEVATVGMPIIRFFDLDTVWLRVYVPEQQIGLLKVGQRAVVTTDAFPNHQYEGRVTVINQMAEFTPKNVQTKDERVKLVFGVKVTVQNHNQELETGHARGCDDLCAVRNGPVASREPSPPAPLPEERGVLLAARGAPLSSGRGAGGEGSRDDFLISL